MKFRNSKELKFVIIFLVAIVAVYSFSGCAKTSKKPIPKPGSSKDYPPAKLDQVRNTTRDIIKESGTKEWNLAQKSIDLLEKDWSELKKQFNSKIPQEKISTFEANREKLKLAVKAKENKKTQETANLMTRQLADFVGYYKGKVPKEVNLLGYYLRETVIGAEFNEMARVDKNYKQAEETWKKIKPQANKVAGEVNFQDKIDSLRMAVNNKQKKNIIKFGDQSLSALDKVETDFKSKKAE